MKALRAPKPKSAIKLAFASTIEYSACKGYTCVKDLEKKSETQVVPIGTAQPSTSTQVIIPFGTVEPLMCLQSREEARLDKGKSLVCADQNSNCQIASVPKDDVTRDDSHATSDISCLDYFGLEEVVNDIAFRFWKCSKCLAMDHIVANCMNKIRCRGCYRYGHKEKSCLNKRAKVSGRWVPKRAGTEISNNSIPVRLPLQDKVLCHLCLKPKRRLPCLRTDLHLLCSQNHHSRHC
jgi:hypothetical protein